MPIGTVNQIDGSDKIGRAPKRDGLPAPSPARHGCCEKNRNSRAGAPLLVRDRGGNQSPGRRSASSLLWHSQR